MNNQQQLQSQVEEQHHITDKIKQQLGKAIIGQANMIDSLLVGLYCNGHVLLEGAPGLAKTLTIKSLAQTLQLSFSRIQFTPDLLPADVVGTMIFNQQQNEFVVKRGPVFAHFVLADEINRAPAKVQSALLQAMQEHQITIGNHTFSLPDPFLVLATQNPLEQEGTYPLPEAQQDRFLLKVLVGYPSRKEEHAIMQSQTRPEPLEAINAVATAQEVIGARNLVKYVYMDSRLEQYLLDLVFATRSPEEHGLKKLKPLLQYGVSPRATIGLAQACRAYALLQKRAFVIPDDIKRMVPDIFRHRIGLTYEADAEEITVENIIQQILSTVSAP